MKRIFGLFLALALALVPSAFAQIAGGNIYGTVSDEQGAVLPGASVTLSGPFTRTTTAGTDGGFRFLSVEAGRYTLSAALSGFATVKREVVVTTNQNVTLSFAMKVAGQQETITVSAETPVVDTKRVGTATTLTKEELTEIPNSRDPWAVLRTIPGVVVDRVNIAGNESGQQSNFNGKGASSDDIMWVIDGVQVDDMAASGATPTYFDYDAFEEMAVTTGGNDVSVQTGSIGLNFTLKRGTNQFTGSLRGYLTHDDLQSSNIKGTALENDARLQGSDKADHIQQISDYGADFGGPILRDKLFFYGSYGKQDIRLVRTNQTADKTILETWSAKMNWQASKDTMVSGLFFNGKKLKYGRDPGLGVQLDAGALWNQGNGYEDFIPGNLHGMWKFEVNHVFSPNFYLNGKYTNYDTGFSLAPSGGTEGSAGVDFDAGTGKGPYEDYGTLRPLKNVTDISGNYFTPGMGGNHQLKFGFGYKKADVTTYDIYGGSTGLLGYINGPGDQVVEIKRQALIKYSGTFSYGYLGDTFTKDRWTINLGARLDKQTAENLPATVPANATFPNILPAIDYPGGGVGISWLDISPRLGITYALGQSRKTVARGSFARYASKLDTGSVTTENPLGVSTIAYPWIDRNGDKLPQANEVNFAGGIQYAAGVNPAAPASVQSPNTIDPDYSAPIDYEAILGLDHELAPNLALSGAWTWRNATNYRGWAPRIGMTSADYTVGPVVSQNGYSAQVWSPNPAKVAASGGGRTLTNRPDYHQGYNGLELTLMKRLSNKWMARAAFSYMDWREYIDGPDAIHNPSRADVSNTTSTAAGAPPTSGPQVDGGQFAERSGGSGKGDIFFNAKWQFIANGLYELPKGFEVAGALYGRQGYLRPIIVRLSAGADGPVRVLGTPNIDDNRYPSLWNLDLRLAKNVMLGGRRKLMLAADLFNVFNSNTELNRVRQANAASFNRLDEILSPRILRFGARFSF
jgi:hypothetical protein